uniref:Sideroflexin 4 n=1 Tax=Myripristis murdjan TaxID=586833 RepID=A0A667YRJ1_9TELE
MDPNLLYWRSQGQSFFSRLRIWCNLLDPSSLLASDAEIQKARSLLVSGEKPNEEVSSKLNSPHLQTIMQISSLLCFFLALLPISAPLVVASLVPHRGVTPALFWQFLLQSYSAGFNYTNRNSSSEQKPSLKQALLVVGAVAYATCAGAVPQIVIHRLGISAVPLQVFFRSILPIPLSAALASFNMYTIRSEESENGIQVFDSKGNPVGISKAAGEKAVRDTALSRAALLGTTAAVPNLLFFFLQRTRLFQRNSLLATPVRHMSAAIVLGLMIPVSFSLFPQLGTIERENLEKELQDAAVDGHLFYHRGL